MYEADTCGSASQDLGTAKPCRHAFAFGSNGSHRTGGIFTFFCEHGICCAFFVIPKAEGRNEAFSYLTKYMKKAPEVIVYDFNCAEHDYILNREPAYYKNTLFVIDRLHIWNHV